MAATQLIFYFSSRDIDASFRDSDFRYPLVEAWRRRGIASYYIRLRRRPGVSEPFGSDGLTDISLLALPKFIREATRRAGGGKPVYFDTTGINFPITLALLKLLLPTGLWCYDLHDDYVYFARGWRKHARAVQQRLVAWSSHVTVRAAATLSELVPGSVALENASEIGPIVRPGGDHSRLLIIGSIDERYDFDMVRRIAELAPSMQIDLWGQVSQNRPDPRGRLAAIMACQSNIRHFGRYHPEQVGAILGRYHIAFAPYRSGIRQTRYLDPLRYYDCLNSGMELITTDIPAARRIADVVHIVNSAEEVVAIWRRLATDAAARRNKPDRYQPVTWDQRADRFMTYCREF